MTKAPRPQTTNTVRWKGAVVGYEGSTSVRYTHAVIGQLREATVRKWAYAVRRARINNTASYIIGTRKSFAADHRCLSTGNIREFARCGVTNGFAAFADQYRKRRIEWFERL